MRKSHFLAKILVLCALGCSALPGPARADAAPSLALQSLSIQEHLTLAGEGQMRFLGMAIYDARLWVDARFTPERFEAHPLALELHYHRAFSAAAIAQRSLTEMQRQRKLPPELAQRWERMLAQLLPDVQRGDRLLGVYLPGEGMQLWRGPQLLGTLREPELARLFFGIWLASQTSEPSLRAALLARVAP